MLLKRGENGTGPPPNAEDGVFGATSITTGLEKPGSGSTISQMETVGKFDHP